MSSFPAIGPVHTSIASRSPGTRLDHRELTDQSFTAMVNAPIQAIDIPNWCFSLPQDEYRACSPDHIAAGFTTALDGRRMSIHVAAAGKSLLVHHYVETVHRSDRLVLKSVSEMFTPSGRTTIDTEWDLSVTVVDNRRCEFTNRLRSRATDDFLAYLAREGISFDQMRSQQQLWCTSHNTARTPSLAASIERAALINGILNK